jgi:multiple antibiotic resistance protein
MGITAWLSTGWLGAFLLAFPTLFTIVDPLGNAIIVSQMTARRSHRERLILARAVALYTMILLLGSLWIGSYFLDFFGVTIGALRTAGGLIIAVSGWQMLNAPEEDAAAEGHNEHVKLITDIAFYPITLPFTAGAGAIAAETTLGAAQPHGDWVLYMVGVSAATAAVVTLVWLLYSYSDLVNRMLGKSASRIIMRLIAIIVLAIGLQFMGAGVHELIKTQIPENDL